MNRMIRSIASTLGETLVLPAFALSLLVTAAVTFADQESDGAKQQRRRHHDELTFTQIDFPGALGTDASSINEFGQILGSYADSTDCINTLVGAMAISWTTAISP